MKLLNNFFIFVGLLFGASFSQGATIRYVQISTNSLTQQTGSYNVASGSITTVYVGTGTVSAPSLTFIGSVKDGLFRVGANIIGFVTNQVKQFEIGTSSITAFQPFYIPDGTVSIPSLSFSADTDTGLRRSGANVWELVAGGVDVSTISTAGVSIKGTTTNDSAAVGFVGEYISSVCANVNSPGSGTTFDAASVLLTPGDWDLSYNFLGFNNSATWSSIITGVTTTSGNSLAGITFGVNGMTSTFGSTSTAVTEVPITLANYRQTLTANTTYYLKTRFSSTSGTPQIEGAILQARRRR